MTKPFHAHYTFVIGHSSLTRIQTGWNSPAAADLRSGLGEFEKWNLFDGAAVRPTRRIGDETVICSAAFSIAFQRTFAVEKCGFWMIPKLLPNGSATLATKMPPPTS